MRCYAVKYNEDITFLCVDDKSKLDFGEPGTAVSSGVRGRQSLVPTVSHLSALDHDVSSKGSLTPSVSLDVDIPQENPGSFYRGQVNVTLKDAIFQASSPFRHAAELIQYMKEKAQLSPLLMIYSDGGPDHRLTYGSVKLSLIAVFRELDLDCLIAGRTAPGHSWANPAERIMSLLNLAYQNAALCREECSSDTEKILRNCSSMDEIRKKAISTPAVKTEWLESVREMNEMLSDRTERVELKENRFKCRTAATDQEIDDLENRTIKSIDPKLEKGKYQKKNLEGKDGFTQFIQNHCRERTYSFQVKKCSTPTCCKPLRTLVGNFPWLPDPELDVRNKGHFKNFDDLLGTETTEKDRPSSQNVSLASVAEDQQGLKNAQLTAQNMRSLVVCYECGKPRCIYSTSKLTSRELRSLKRLLEQYDYSCGSTIVPDDDALHGKMCVRLQMSCTTCLEFPYYSSGFGKADKCCYCASDGATRNGQLLKEYKVVLPVCQDCIKLGKNPPKRQPRK